MYILLFIYTWYLLLMLLLGSPFFSIHDHLLYLHMIEGGKTSRWMLLNGLRRCANLDVAMDIASIGLLPHSWLLMQTNTACTDSLDPCRQQLRIMKVGERWAAMGHELWEESPTDDRWRCPANNPHGSFINLLVADHGHQFLSSTCHDETMGDPRWLPWTIDYGY